MLFALEACALDLEISSICGFQRARGIWLFNHWKHMYSLSQCLWLPNLARRLLTIKDSHWYSHMALITWSFKITWQTKTIISLLTYWLWPPNLTGWWLNSRSSKPWRHMTLWSLGLTRSRDKLKPCLHCHSAYGHQTWQDADLLWGAPSHEVTWPLSYVMFQDQVTN